MICCVTVMRESCLACRRIQLAELIHNFQSYLTIIKPISVCFHTSNELDFDNCLNSSFFCNLEGVSEFTDGRKLLADSHDL